MTEVAKVYLPKFKQKNIDVFEMTPEGYLNIAGSRNVKKKNGERSYRFFSIDLFLPKFKDSKLNKEFKDDYLIVSTD